MVFKYAALRRILGVSCCIVMAFFLAGCLPSTSEGPDRLFSVDDEVASLRTSLRQPELFDTTETGRNAYVLARMYAIDLQYYRYEAGLTHERQDVNFAADVVNIGLTSSIPLVAATTTKNVLGATASALTGIRTSYNDDILLNRTIQILQSQMRTNRSLLAAAIIKKLKQSTSSYPLALALSDLEDYYRAGTISGALLAVNTAVSAQEDAAQGLRTQAAVGSIVTDPTRPLTPLSKGTPKRLAGDVSSSPAEQLLRVEQIRNIEAMVCAQVDGKLGPRGSSTRQKIVAFLKKKDPTRGSLDVLTFEDRAVLLDATDAGEKSAC